MWLTCFVLICASWSRNSRFVLTTSKDWNVVLWDLASDTDPPKRRTTVRFDAPVSSASFHPRNRYSLWSRCTSITGLTGRFSQILLVLLSPGDAYIVDLRKKYRTRVELCEVQDEDEDEDVQMSKPRCAIFVYSLSTKTELTLGIDQLLLWLDSTLQGNTSLQGHLQLMFLCSTLGQRQYVHI